MTQSVVRLGFNKSCFPWVLWLFCFALDCDFTYGKVDFKEGQAIRAIGFQWRPFNLSRSFLRPSRVASGETTDFYGECYFALHIAWPASCFGLLSRSVLIGSMVAGPYRLGVVTRDEGRVDPSVLRRWITGKAGRSWIRWTRAKFVMKHFRDAFYLHMALSRTHCILTWMSNFGFGLGWSF